eukprot:TRINITY_DN45_c6_g1_i1.p1 TRINITY_DN45_c6_g1~~TRINITY_DN45_c6_g1_i1.p1  ORF type:complete len:273 (+),score=62.17 TRINITY_DN45_c6_g1_i1:47-820(+)
MPSLSHLLACIAVLGVSLAAEDTVTVGVGCFFKGKQSFEESGLTLSKIAMGYSGGFVMNPSFEKVMRGRTGHAEVLHISFDPNETPLKRILDVFWESHDPTSLNKQGDDIGSQYRSVLFFNSPEQNETMHESKLKYDLSGVSKKKAVTEVVAFENFYPVEENIAEIASEVSEKIKKEHDAFVDKIREQQDPNVLEQKLIEVAEQKSALTKSSNDAGSNSNSDSSESSGSGIGNSDNSESSSGGSDASSSSDTEKESN